jgi:hypothetical protein
MRVSSLLALVIVAAAPLSPADVVRAAYRDAYYLPREESYQARYVSLAHLPEAGREAFARLVGYAINCVSRGPRIVPPAAVPGTKGALLRVRLADYHLKAKAWDDLARKGSGVVRVSKKVDQPEPYYHIKDKDGTLSHAPWVPVDTATHLATVTYSDFPILRGDWLVANALISPAYEELLGFRSLDDFKAFVGFSAAVRDRSAVKGIVVDSQEVSHNQRAALLSPAPYGPFMETFDFFTSVGDDDLMEDLLKGRRDAAEYIAYGPNKLQYYLLTNGQDAIVNFADPNVVADRNTSWKVKAVWNALSCITCHTQGVKDLRDEVRELIAPPGLLNIKDKEDAQEVMERFTPPLDGPPLAAPLGTGRATYAIGVAEATGGMTPPQLAAAIERAFVGYHQQTLSIDDAAREVGCTPAEAKEILARTINLDARLTQLLAGRPVRRDQWEAKAYSQLALLVYQRRQGK